MLEWTDRKKSLYTLRSKLVDLKWYQTQFVVIAWASSRKTYTVSCPQLHLEFIIGSEASSFHDQQQVAVHSGLSQSVYPACLSDPVLPFFPRRLLMSDYAPRSAARELLVVRRPITCVGILTAHGPSLWRTGTDGRWLGHNECWKECERFERDIGKILRLRNT